MKLLRLGWFRESAQHRGDFGVKGITLSEEQHDYANERLGKKADIVLEDYRHQTGKFDNIVSIEMFEAVGERYWSTYFSKISELLSKNGKAVIQTITMNEKTFRVIAVAVISFAAISSQAACSRAQLLLKKKQQKLA